MFVMSAVLLLLDLLCAILVLCSDGVLCSGPAFALGPVVSQAPGASETGKAASIPQEGHAVEPGGSPSSAGNAASNATEETLVIPQHYQTMQDPLAPINEKSFSVNEKIDQRALHPIANLWSKTVPKRAQDCITRFFDNTEVIPRFANALFQLRLKWAGGELARFGINSTLGIAGLFDPAQAWFGLKEHDNNFSLTLARYGMMRGFYLMPPIGGPIDAREVIGGPVDGMMSPLNYLVPGSVMFYKVAAHSLEGLNARAQKQSELDDLDRFAIDKYGAVQDAYVQKQIEHERAVTVGSK
jgi:phospholipid-binding lipoprotein MlaA